MAVHNRANKERYKAQKRETQKRMCERNIEFIEWIKANNTCHDCGGKFDPVCMQFHHEEKGKYRVSDYFISPSMLLKELERCVIVCANCHCIRHKDESSGRRTNY